MRERARQEDADSEDSIVRWCRRGYRGTLNMVAPRRLVLVRSLSGAPPQRYRNPGGHGVVEFSGKEGGIWYLTTMSELAA
jgi:hypothetical protein